MFNLKHPLSIRLQRWMTVVLALGVFSVAPLADERFISAANAGEFRSTWSTAAVAIGGSVVVGSSVVVDSAVVVGSSVVAVGLSTAACS